MRQLVKLWQRPSADGQRFTYYLLYIDEDGKRKQRSLGHADKRKAERQQAQLERDLRTGFVEPESMRLSEFAEDSIRRTRGQVRESTIYQMRLAMKNLMQVVGNIDYRQVRHRHGERFVQGCLDQGQSPASVAKKIRHLKRIFQLAVDRGLLEENPLQRVKQPRVARRKIRVLGGPEVCALLAAAEELYGQGQFNWDLAIHMALCTGMRRGELLNLVWQDVDLTNKVVEVSPKNDSGCTWRWDIKDVDRRMLALPDSLVKSLAEHQMRQTKVHPYVFIPAARYETIQERRQHGKWSFLDATNPLNNFDRQFRRIVAAAGIGKLTFHDLRRTCMTNWLANGLSPQDVMILAGHSSFDTTRRFYLGIPGDLVDRTRAATERILKSVFVANLLQQGSRSPEGSLSASVNPLQKRA